MNINVLLNVLKINQYVQVIHMMQSTKICSLFDDSTKIIDKDITKLVSLI